MINRQALKRPRENHLGESRIEVFSDKELGKGADGIIQRLDTYSLEENGTCLPIKKPPEKSRVVKIYHKFDKEKINREHKLTPSERRAKKPIDNYMVMGILPPSGCLLSTYLKERHPTQKEQLKLAINLLREVIKIHDQNINHRDIKPDNIWVVPDSLRVIIFDFSLSKRLTDLPEQGRCIGTPLYMPWEQLYSEQTDEKSDGFAAGLVIGEICKLLSTRQVYIGPHTSFEVFQEYISKVENILYISNQYSNWTDFQEKMATVANKLTAREQKDRYTPTEALDALYAIQLTESNNSAIAVRKQLDKIETKTHTLQKISPENQIKQLLIESLQEIKTPIALKEYVDIMEIEAFSPIKDKKEAMILLIKQTLITWDENKEILFNLTEQLTKIPFNPALKKINATLSSLFRKYLKYNVSLDKMIALNKRLSEEIPRLQREIESFLCKKKIKLSSLGTSFFKKEKPKPKHPVDYIDVRDLTFLNSPQGRFK
ncbi:MAG: hypothetical protein EPO11_09050 [Gammaproteobacteria bacterium]|nr:MAG: hypothetical protein EPO11_09050 [Gammaproteobacteria bacterium]